MRGKLNAATLTLSILAALFLFWLAAAGARGNGVPVKVYLNYIPGISNWGPETANGEAVLSVGEGWVTVSVQGLPKLRDEVYLAWLIPQEGLPIPVGKFDTDDAGTGDFEMRELSLPEVQYKLFLVTVEEDSDQYETPGYRRSIAGRFLDPELRPPPSPMATPSSMPGGPPGHGGGTGGEDPGTGTGSSLTQPVPTQPAPVMLPVTGGVVEPEQSGTGAGWGLAGVGGLAFIALVGLIAFRRACPVRYRRRRRL